MFLVISGHFTLWLHFFLNQTWADDLFVWFSAAGGSLLPLESQDPAL